MLKTDNEAGGDFIENPQCFWNGGFGFGEFHWNGSIGQVEWDGNLLFIEG